MRLLQWLSRLAVVGAALAAALLPLPRSLVERWYSAGLYAHLQPLVTRASSAVPVALFDVAAGIIALVAVLTLIGRWRRTGAGAALLRSALSLLVLAALLYLWFLAFWGFNYRRLPLEAKLAYDPSRITRDSAMRLAHVAARQANALQPASAASFDEQALAASFGEVERQLGMGWQARLAAPKPSLLTYYFRQAAIDGMTVPFFLEIIVNPDLLPFERPYVLAHEWAHLAGFADEAEAGFVGWLACIRGAPPARYSGWLAAYLHVSSELPRADRLALREQLSPAVLRDLVAVQERLARATPVVRAAARDAYDTYLRANRVDEGIESYGAVVRLMLGTSYAEDWTPQRQP